MSKLVSETQCNFIPSRQATNRIFIAQEVFCAMWRWKGSCGFMDIKIDLERTYDRIEWDFLETVLRHLGLMSI